MITSMRLVDLDLACLDLEKSLMISYDVCEDPTYLLPHLFL